MARLTCLVLVSGLAFAAHPAAAQDEPVYRPPSAASPVESAPSVPRPNDEPAKQPDVAGETGRREAPAAENALPSPPSEPKSAETPPPDVKAVERNENRFTFSRVQDGYVRLDNRTGQVSYCSKRTVGWVCQLAPEDRGVYENEIARLQEENAALKKDLLSRGLALPGGVKGEPPTSRNDRDVPMPPDPNFERAKLFVEKLWHRLIDMVVEFQKEILKKN